MGELPRSPGSPGVLVIFRHGSSGIQIPENCANAANSWIPASGRSRTRSWDLFLIRKTFCPLQSSQLELNPANMRNSAHGRRLETTGRYNLIAPSWLHDRSPRARRRMARKRTSRRRYGQARTLGRRAAAGLHDRVDCGESRRLVGPVHHMSVCIRGRPGGGGQAAAPQSAQRPPRRRDSLACLRTATPGRGATKRRRR